MEAWQLRALQGFEQRTLSCRALLGELCAVDPLPLSADGSRPSSPSSSPVRARNARSRSSTPLGRRGRPQSYAELHLRTASACPAVALAHLGFPSESCGGSSSSVTVPKSSEKLRPDGAEEAEDIRSLQRPSDSRGEAEKKGKGKGSNLKGKGSKATGSNQRQSHASSSQAAQSKASDGRGHRLSSSSIVPCNTPARSRRPDSARLERLSKPRHPPPEKEPPRKSPTPSARRLGSTASAGARRKSPSRGELSPRRWIDPSYAQGELYEVRPEMATGEAKPQMDREVWPLERLRDSPEVVSEIRDVQDVAPQMAMDFQVKRPETEGVRTENSCAPSIPHSDWELVQTVRAELGSLAEVAGWAALSCKQTQPLAEALLGQVRRELLCLEQFAGKLPGTRKQICEIQEATRQAMDILQEALRARGRGCIPSEIPCQAPSSQSLRCEEPQRDCDVSQSPDAPSTSNSAVLAAALGDLVQGMRQALDEIHKVRGTSLEATANQSKFEMSVARRL